MGRELLGNTYAHIVNHLVVRILFALSVNYILDTRSIDFVFAFSQAKLDVDDLWSSYGIFLSRITGLSCSKKV